MRKKDNVFQLPLTTEIEVVALRKGFEPVVKVMTYENALEIKKKKGWNYIFYQKGFSQFKNPLNDNERVN